MLQDKKLKTDNMQALLALIEKILVSSNLDLEINKFLHELEKIFPLKKVFFAVHGGNELIFKENETRNFDKNSLEKILQNISLGKPTNLDPLFIYPLKIHNQFIACLGFEKELDSDLNHDQIELLAHLFAIAISQNQLVSDLRANNEKLLLLDKQKTELISTISHELRTPMANIMGFSELLLNKDFDATTSKNYTREIYEASLRLSNLISNFLDLSRLEVNGFLQFNNLEEAEIDWLAEHGWQQLANLNKKHKLTINKDDGLPSVIVDNDAITRVFVNLFSNAIKYSQDHNEIICTIKNLGDQIQVTVTDQGIGISERDMAKIFERFYRVNCPKTKFVSGTGLGLWITKEIISSHGGKIWVESKTGEGSSFTFTIPIGNNISNG